MFTLFGIFGLLLLVLGSEFLVRGASRLARSMGISPLVIGLTVVALGTSSPEVAVTVISSRSGESALALGNVIGSNLCNILLVGGLCAVIAPLAVRPIMVWFHTPVMIASAVAAYLFALDGKLNWWEGVLFLGCFVVYVALSLKFERKAQRRSAAQQTAKLGAAEFPGYRALVYDGLLVLAGLCALLLGSQFLVRAAVALALWAGVGEAVIGLTVVAIGTSLPEIAASVMATLRGEREIALGNIIGSNISNIFLVLGAGTVAAYPDAVVVSRIFITSDFPLMLAVCAVCFPLVLSHYRISRGEGALLLFGYLLYIVMIGVCAAGYGWSVYLRPLLYLELALAAALALRSAAVDRAQRVRNDSGAASLY